jgi:cytolysin (calcineurin-like family phosphatase)
MIFKAALLAAISLSLTAVQAKAQQDFHMLFVGDPQHPWTHPMLAGDDLIKESKRVNMNVIKSMNKHVRTLGTGKVKGLIINGDLTNFGKADELEGFNELYKEVSVPLYLGLGNHDYANNVDDCYRNHCAIRMVDFMRKHINELGFDQEADLQFFSYHWTGDITTGSLAYSWDIGNVHFVQLHNFPSYTKSWSGHGKIFQIRDAMVWLENDLAEARRSGKAIILNMHDAGEHWNDSGMPNITSRFKSMLDQYKVSAVFVGHLHSLLGESTTNAPASVYGTVPVFYSGSPSYQTYLSVEFSRQGQKMTVTPIDAKDGGVTVGQNIRTWRLKTDHAGGEWVQKGGTVNDGSYFGPLEDQYLHLEQLHCKSTEKATGFTFSKIGNRLAPILICGSGGREVKSTWGGSYSGPLEDQYADTRTLACPDDKAVRSFALIKRGNRVAPSIRCEGNDSWIRAQGEVHDTMYFGRLEDQYADTNTLRCPSGEHVNAIKFRKRGNRLAPAIFCK